MGDSRHPDDCQPTVEFCRRVSCFIPHQFSKLALANLVHVIQVTKAQARLCVAGLRSLQKNPFHSFDATLINGQIPIQSSSL